MNVRILLGATLLVPAAPGYGAEPCSAPDSMFESFLTRFAEDKAFQLSRIAYPLRIKYTPPTSERAVIQHWPRSRVEKVDWPLFLSLTELKRHGYKQTLRKRSATHMTVRHDSGGDAYVRTFDFRNRDGCWTLTYLADDSL